MYKDKQREAIKQATQRYRAKKGDSALSGQKQGLKNARGCPVSGDLSDTHPVIPSNRDTQDVIPVIPKQSHNPMMVGYVPPKG